MSNNTFQAQARFAGHESLYPIPRIEQQGALLIDSASRT
jgi:hypothetical protein